MLQSKIFAYALFLCIASGIFYRDVDVSKLRIAIRVIRTLLGLAIALQAISRS
jgi:hypothetical protein